MATILNFDPARFGKRNATESDAKPLGGSAQVLMFTGIRRERLPAGSIPYAPLHHEPMFNDPAPAKPSGRKPRSGKTG